MKKSTKKERESNPLEERYMEYEYIKMESNEITWEYKHLS